MAMRNAEQRVLRFCDYDRSSREADACGPRDPSEACAIVVLPVIRIERPDNLKREKSR